MPYHKKDINKLERVQRRSSNIPELKHFCYERRLLECELTTLETRRIRGEQMKVFKIRHGNELRYGPPQSQTIWRVDGTCDGYHNYIKFILISGGLLQKLSLSV